MYCLLALKGYQPCCNMSGQTTPNTSVGSSNTNLTGLNSDCLDVNVPFQICCAGKKLVIYEITAHEVKEIVDVELAFRAILGVYVRPDAGGDDYILTLGFSKLAIYSITRQHLTVTDESVSS